MVLEYRKSESTIRPATLEFATDVVYIRKNIFDYTSEDGVLYYRYDEATVSQEDYALYTARQNQANIDYLSMELGIDL